MTVQESAFITFGATFAGVFASFLLWLGGTYAIKCFENRNTRKCITSEILEEIRLNMSFIEITMKTLQKAINGANVPLLFARLTYSGSSYAISSGELRLLPRRKQRIVSYVVTMCQEHNHFAENTEQLLAILLLRNDSLALVRYRLEGFLEESNKTKSALEKYLRSLEQEKLPESEVHSEPLEKEASQK